eukprot:3415762-Lingulodinium_polyedra.AAC.1
MTSASSFWWMTGGGGGASPAAPPCDAAGPPVGRHCTGTRSPAVSALCLLASVAPWTLAAAGRFGAAVL